MWDITRVLDFIVRALGKRLWVSEAWTASGSVCKPSQARSWVQAAFWKVSPENYTQKKQQEGLCRALLKEQPLHILCMNP